MRQKPLVVDFNFDQNENKDPFLQEEDDFRLSELIPRILYERRSFLNITEDSLKREIESSNTLKKGVDGENEIDEQNVHAVDDDDQIIPEEIAELKDAAAAAAAATTTTTTTAAAAAAATTTETPAPGTTTESAQDIFNRQRIELSKDVANALNETSLSLDFVSLLLSSVKPNISKNTMSPHLQKFIKPSSLNSDKLEVEDADAAANDSIKNNKVGQGWKAEAMKKVTELFKTTSENVKQQVAKERRYWNMINLVRSNNEALFRMRDPVSNARAIGVRYGYSDSGSDLSDKGLALLRKNTQTGEISFVPLSSNTSQLNNNTSQRKYVRVRMLTKFDDDYIVTGQSRFNYDYNTSTHDIINQIENARVFLFETDLFYQLTREAKILLSYKVATTQDKISIEIADGIIEIENAVYDELNEEPYLGNYYQNVNEASSINNDKCQLVLTYFKLMLCCFYKYNLKLKQKVPTSLTKWKQSNSHPLILRPFLGNIRHESYISCMQKILEDLVAGKSIKKEEGDNDNYNKPKLHKFSNLKEKSKNPFQKAIEKPRSVFDLSLHNSKSNVLKIKIVITTNELFVDLILRLTTIKYETVTDFEADINGTNILQMDFNDFEEIQTCLDWTIRDFL
ncbi:uncharacterized protein LODBEIA_P28470 [Lodderomyces beijingensis]|uniref:Mediator of RNA polymerase II transcription subunit 17 n=1 Tax=Lodderomyces beijingensis TaxID=1775926 RepID=A0ABP0ZKE7_9ASCO